MNLVTRFLLENKQRLTTRFLILGLALSILLLGLPAMLRAQDADCFPSKPNRLVNDYTQAISPQQADALEAKLLAFNQETSTQIAIAMVSDLCGYDRAQYTYTLAEKWGVGKEGKNNGILIMVVPFGGPGQRTTFIAVGYGLEGVVPDAIAKRIVEQELIPNFKQNDFYTGLNAATDVLMGLTKGEFTAEEYAPNNAGSAVFGAFLVLFILALVLLSRIGSVRKYAHRNDLSFWAALALMNAAANSRSGSFQNFSGGGGFGSGGGFGGFGGGSFGGGGAGGSW